METSFVVGGPRGRAVKSVVSKSLDHLTAVCGVGLSPVLATCETSHVLLAGVQVVFLIYYLEKNVKLN